MTGGVRLEPFGDSAILATFGEAIEPAINARVHAAARAVAAARNDGAPWSMPIPAYASLLVGYDALRVDVETAINELSVLLAGLSDAGDESEAPLVEIPVRYGGDDGPDLDAVAERTGLTPAQVVDLHMSVVYRVYMLGFAPGFAYLGELPAELEVPRRETPRQRVPAGSVAIAGRQTAVYPARTPGGWQLIGRTDVQMWDSASEQPALIVPGSAVRFVARA